MPSYSFESASDRGCTDSISNLRCWQTGPLVVEMIRRRGFAADAFVQAT